MGKRAERLAFDLAAIMARHTGLTKAAGGSLYAALLPVCEVVTRQDKAARKRHRQVKAITRDLRKLARQEVTPGAYAAYRRHSDQHMAALWQHQASRLAPFTPPGPPAAGGVNGHDLNVGRTDGRADAPPGHPG